MPRHERVLRWVERLLIVVGLAGVGWYGFSTMEAAQFQRAQTAAFERAIAQAQQQADVRLTPSRPTDAVPAATAATSTGAPEGDAAAGAPAAVGTARDGSTAAFPARRPAFVPTHPRMIGMLEIPRLKLSTTVLTGDDDKTLKVSAGHLPDTPRPWESGNSAIAAHRDSHFRPLRHVKVGDLVRMRTVHGDLDYKVSRIRIVTPKDISVLDPTGTDMLTLITCYPFNYIGNAPKRYIIHAERVSSAIGVATTQ